MTTWPSDLPQFFMRENYSEKLPNNLARSQTDVGPAKVRRRSTSNVGEMGGSMFMTIAQLATLREFHDVTLSQGAHAFEFPDQYGGSTPLAVRFKEPFTIGGAGLDVRVGIIFEVLP